MAERAKGEPNPIAAEAFQLLGGTRKKREAAICVSVFHDGLNCFHLPAGRRCRNCREALGTGDAES